MADAIIRTSGSTDDFWTVHQGDARHTGPFLEKTAEALGRADEPFLQSTITSPPYATLVDYGPSNQIGFGQSHDDYLQSCREIFADIFRWTKSTGSLWVIADTLLDRTRSPKPSRLIPLPFQLAAEAEKAGWVLREVIIWRKDRTRPWSHRGKLRNGFEYILFFVKAKDFTFNVDRLRETSSLKSWWVKYPERHNPWGMTPDNVWEIPIPVQGSWDDSAMKHACPFPPELVRRMVELSTDEGDVVFDPFSGTGTVVSGALSEGRRGFGTELNPAYVEAFHAIGRDERPATPSADPAVSSMTRRLLELRMLKYPKELGRQVLRSGFTPNQVRAVVMQVGTVNFKPSTSNYGSITCQLVVADDLSELELARLHKNIRECMARAPLSKYGLSVSVEVHTLGNVSRILQGTLAVYTNGKTWHAARVMDAHAAHDWLLSSSPLAVTPIFSSLHVTQALEEN